MKVSLWCPSDLAIQHWYVSVSEVFLFAFQVHPDLSRQLLQDGYRLDEIPDDEDLDLIPPKAMGSSVCCCSEGPSCSMQWSQCHDSNLYKDLAPAPASDFSHWCLRPFFLTQDHCCAAWELPALKPNSFLCRTVLHWEDSRDTHENTGGHKNKPYPLWPKAWYYFFLSYYFYRSHHLGNVVIGEPFTVFSTVVNGSAAL